MCYLRCTTFILITQQLLASSKTRFVRELWVINLRVFSDEGFVAEDVLHHCHHPADHPALAVEARVPPPRAAPAVLRRVVLSLLSIKRIRLRAVLT